MLVAAFSLTQLLFSPLAGRLSDTMGRKNHHHRHDGFRRIGMVVRVASTPPLLFASRMLGGIGAALIMPAVMAYTADVTSNEERARGMGFINAAITTGFIIGPGIGGFIAEFGIRVPFYAAAVAGGIAALVTPLPLPESSAKQEAPTVLGRKKESLAVQLVRSFKEPYFLSLIIVFVLSFGLANYETVFGLFVDHKFGFTPKDIAMIITFGSIAGAVVQATIFGWILNRFGEKRVITLSLLTAGICILLTLFVHKYWLIFLVTFLVFLSIDILRPAIGTQMSKLAKDQQGYVAGLNSAYTSLGNIAGPLVAGYLFDLDINFPYISASIVLILCFFLAMRAGRAWTATEAVMNER